MCWIRYGRSLRQNEMKKDKNIILDNFIWRFAERCGAQLVTAVVTLLLARILMPEDYGRIALVEVFMNIMYVFVDCGLCTALIQKKEADEIDYSSVFYFDLVTGFAMYAIIFLAAPYIAAFYNDTELTAIVRVIGLMLIFAGLKGIQQVYVSRNMIFKLFFFSTLGGTVFSAGVGLWLAYSGFGAWALVAQQLSNTAVDTLILWLTVGWRPKRLFSWQRLKGMLSYGWKLLASSLLGTIYNNLRSLLIGRVYTSADLAYYNQGQMLPDAITNNVDSSIDSVLFPVMSAEQDDASMVKDMTRRAIKMGVYIISPLMMAIAFCAEPLVRLILTEKWLPCVPYLRIFCVAYMFWPIHAANLNALKAMGRSDIYLKLDVPKKILDIVLLLITYRISVMAMAYSLWVANGVSHIINSWPNRKLLNYGCLEQLLDILPNVLLSVFTGGCMWLVSLARLPDLMTLIFQILLGLAVYLAGSALLKLNTFSFLWDVVKPKLQKKPWADNEE